MSIKYRIALLFSLLVTLIFAVVSPAIYFFSAKEREHTFKNRLMNRALSTARIYTGNKDVNLSILRRIDAGITASLYKKSIIITSNGAVTYASSDEPGDTLILTQNDIEQAKADGDYFFQYKDKMAVAIHQSDSDEDFIISVAASDPDGREYLSQLKDILLVALTISVALSFLAGLAFAKRLVRPIKAITGEVNLITSQNLSQRIKVNDSGDELTKLARTFNDLLDRLQDSFSIQRRFISNASHELSTPLTSISSQLEVVMQKRRSPEEYEEVIQSVHEDCMELQQLTRSLLDIAKTGSEGSINLAEVRLDEVVLKVVADIQKQNRHYKIELDFGVFPDDEKLLTVFGNNNLLYMALRNVVENGCKYSENHLAALTMAFDKNSIIISVASMGDIISESDIQNIFQPFFRAESAQQKPGFGLGLTLTRRILSLHKGTIAVESGPAKGTIFTIQLPCIVLKH